MAEETGLILTSVHLKQTGSSQSTQHVCFGVPIAQGQVTDVSAVRLRGQGFQITDFHIGSSAFWPDGSVRWMLVDARVPRGVPLDTVLHIEIGSSASNRRDSLAPLSQFRADDDGLVKGILAVDGLFESAVVRVAMVDANDRPVAFTMKKSPKTKGNRLRKETSTDFFANRDGRSILEMSIDVTEYSELGDVCVGICLLNPDRAQHTNGLWDLGDGGSQVFKSLTVEFVWPEPCQQTLIVTDRGRESEYRLGSSELRLYQASSGGENWDSRNHVDASNRVPLEFRGYRLFNGNKFVGGGERANPEIVAWNERSKCCIQLEKFWQEFPSAVTIRPGKVRVELFPEIGGRLHELQGGERKRQQVNVSFRKQGKPAASPPIKTLLDPEYVKNTRAMPLFSSHVTKHRIRAILDTALDPEYGFVAKREWVDEYGWRNYGELYADHEQHHFEGDGRVVSHYNNQYDPILSLLRQGLISGESEWMGLALDLSDHVIDIDIYHTHRDRAEYNGGLFWHTDHYSTAHTCTHRTFSAKNSTTYDGELGGGPGTEHCYTSGLVELGFITGNERLHEEAETLIRWLDGSFRGSEALMAWMRQLLKEDIPLLRRVIGGETVSKYRFPLTRGTGNYVNSLVDFWILDGDTSHLERASTVAKQTFHPNDDLSLRFLHETEERWSYLVFLQSVGRLLYVQAVLKNFDEDFEYLRTAFLHYARYVRDTEVPFLDHPERLEFVNQTWTAQDSRKPYILEIAGALDNAEAQRFRSRSDDYWQYIADALEKSDERIYTRVLVVLMQNIPLDREDLDGVFGAVRTRAEGDNNYSGEPPVWTISSIVANSAKRGWHSLLTFSFRREWRWLRHRL